MKTIIEMAQEAGLAIAYDESEEDGWQELKAFAALVRADEREACKKLVQEQAANYKMGGKLYRMLGMNTSQVAEIACDHIAHLISERGQA